LTINNYH